MEAQPRQWMIRKPDVSAGREQLKAEILVAEIGGLAKQKWFFPGSLCRLQKPTWLSFRITGEARSTCNWEEFALYL